MHDPFSSDEFLELGFVVRGFANWRGQSKASQVRDFRGLYGTSPEVLSIIWERLRSTDNPQAKLAKHETPKHLLLLYRWIKRMETEVELRTQFEWSLEKIRKAIRRMAKCVATILEGMVSRKTCFCRNMNSSD